MQMYKNDPVHWKSFPEGVKASTHVRLEKHQVFLASQALFH